VLVAIDAIDDLVYRGRRWTRLDVRHVDLSKYAQAIERLRTEIRAALIEPGQATALELTDRLEAIGEHSLRPPVVGGVMLNRNKVCDVLDELRQVIPAALIAQRKAGQEPV
jgi:hypothetical protein